MNDSEKGPSHVDNLNSISKLKLLGFKGDDISLAISLFEYGLAWRKLDNDEILFVYSIGKNRFDRCSMKPRDPMKEWPWVDWKAIARDHGLPLSEYLRAPFEFHVSSVITRHGYESTFGTSYWEGFEIHEN